MRAGDLVVLYPTVGLAVPAVAAATVLEVAALTARTRSPLVAVSGDGGVVSGAITSDALPDRMLES